jgi:hypothetical protein
VAGRAALRQGLAGFAAVGGGEGAGALRYVGADRRGAAVVEAANGAAPVTGVVVLFKLVQLDVVGPADEAVDIIVVVAVFCSLVDKQFPMYLLISLLS